MSVKRLLQPRMLKPNHDPSSTNLIAKYSVSRKGQVTLGASGVLEIDGNSVVSTLFPEFNSANVSQFRFDRIVTWGSRDGQSIRLKVGDYFQREDVAGINQRACVGCAPQLRDGQSDLSTAIVVTSDAGALFEYHVSGVIFVTR